MTAIHSICYASLCFFAFFCPEQAHTMFLLLGLLWLGGTVVFIPVEIYRMVKGQAPTGMDIQSWLRFFIAVCGCAFLASYQNGTFWFRCLWGLLLLYLFLNALINVRNKPLFHE